MRQYHLAQVNIARTRADMNDPVMAGLVARVNEMNQLAESSTGFVWRLHGEAITHSMLHIFQNYFVPFDAARLFYNLSVWEGIEDLQYFVTKTAHADMLRDRHKWMDGFNRASLALWWTPAGHSPTVVESAERLRSLDYRGPTPYAFTLSTRFESPA